MEGVVADKIEIQYNGKKIAGAAIKDIGGNLSQFPFLLMLEQSKTEKLLLKFIERQGWCVERNVEFKSFSEHQSRITTQVTMPDGSGHTIVSNYLIAADGSKSAIRDFLNIPFKGKSYARPIFILDCGAISGIGSGVITFAFSRRSVAGFFPLRNQRWRVDGSFPGRLKKAETITPETVTSGLQNWNNLHINVHHTEWLSVSHSQQKYARTIRSGNCFLAGDSAHVNTPVGAQGMNTGLQDAHNLAWKLAFVLRHQAKPELLDSYSTERLGISRGFARYADVIFKLVTNTTVAVRLFRTVVLKLYFTWIFPKLDNKEKWRLRFFKSISQINIHYKPAFDEVPDLEKFFLDGSPKPGFRLPYLGFVYDHKNTNSHQILKAAEYTLIVLAEALTPEILSISKEYKLAVFLLEHRPETDNIYASLGITNMGYYLIRPDMYIGLRSPTMETDRLTRYLHQLLIGQ
jgi:2-polyprenyl-6-methoxyphenol hydroxylase-like FAD-dependent oxidoreductase